MSATAEPQKQRRLLDRLAPLVPVLLVVVAAWFLFARGMQRDLNHDEHQFLAPGALLSREGLLPYRDYPLFHLPNLVFAYAGLDYVTGQLVFSAKAFSVAATAGMVALLVWVVWRERDLSFKLRLALAAAMGVVFLYDPVVLYTSGKTWNHEVPTFLLAAALLIQATTFRNPSLAAGAAAGLLGALSAGSRLTFGPSLIPLFVLAFLAGESWRARIRHGLAWSAGAFVGFLPSVAMLVAYPDAFLFGNFEFPRLRVSDATNLRVQQTIRWDRKIGYFLKEIMRPSWPLFLLLLAGALPLAWRWLRDRNGPVVTAFTVLVLPFALLGCFAPARYQYQHYYGVIGLVAVAVAGALPQLARSYRARWVYLGAVGVVAASVFMAARNDDVGALYALRNRPMEKWFVWDVTKENAPLRDHLAGGTVLTLAPVYVLEAGLKIVPEFAVGPFGLRSAHLVPPERRTPLKLPAATDFSTYLAKQMPDGILTGVEDKELEEGLIDFAKSHQYRRVKIGHKRTLWVRDLALTGGAEQIHARQHLPSDR